jgi:hypothetical protein
MRLPGLCRDITVLDYGVIVTEYLRSPCHISTDSLCHLQPETHNKRQAAQHDCLFSLVDDGDEGIEIVYTVRKNIFVPGRVEQPRQNKNFLYWHDKPYELA